MKVPAQIIFKDIPRYESIEQRIEVLTKKLDTFCDQIMSCRVVVAVPHQHHVQGNPYSIRIEMTVPGKEIIATAEPAEQSGIDDVNLAINEAFDSAKRQLQDYMRRRRRQTKLHNKKPIGVISSLNFDEQYGYISTSEGEKIYFHANSIINGDFHKLTLGSLVSFEQEDGDQGAQASSIILKKKAALLSKMPVVQAEI
jgi:cold shock CspA family protein/ribosome-associated translation inhibitor RaiA